MLLWILFWLKAQQIINRIKKSVHAFSNFTHLILLKCFVKILHKACLSSPVLTSHKTGNLLLVDLNVLFLLCSRNVTLSASGGLMIDYN